VLGPNFNDEYGDTYSLIWAFEADGFSDAELKDVVKATRLRLLRVPEVTKADLFGVQDEVFIEFATRSPCWACRSTDPRGGAQAERHRLGRHDRN
jgi:multidrug efflux pump